MKGLMSTDKCKSIDDKNHQDQKEEKILNTSLTKLKSRLPVTLVNGMDEGEIHLERMKKKVEGEG